MCRDAMEAELHQFEDQVREIEDQIRLGHPSSLLHAKYFPSNILK